MNPDLDGNGAGDVHDQHVVEGADGIDDGWCPMTVAKLKSDHSHNHIQDLQLQPQPLQSASCTCLYVHLRFNRPGVIASICPKP